MILEQLPFVRLRFDLQAKRDAQVPPFKGSLVREALFWWLSERWCQDKSHRHHCPDD